MIQKHSLCLLISFLLIVACSTVAFYAGISRVDSGRFMQFDSALFRLSNSDGTTNDRYLMRYDALAVVGTGKQYRELIGLLGKPDFELTADEVR